MDKKREKGQFFTKKNLFKLKSFQDWFFSIPKYSTMKYVEPFAGEIDLKKFMDQIDSSLIWSFYDIDPKIHGVNKNDSIKNFPKDYDFCITNPPYLAKNSAKRRGLNYPKTDYDDLYKLALEKCLENCRYVAAIIPESFITANLFHERLERVISINFIPFDDTEHPVCLALFAQEESNDFEIFLGEKKIGNYNFLKKKLPKENKSRKIKFNDPDGDLALIAVDNTTKNSIRFCPKEEVKKEEIKVSSRSRTRLKLEEKDLNLIKDKFGSMDKFLERLNLNLEKFRKQTQDVFLTSFKGLRKDGKYRRRLDFKLAKKLIDQSLK